MQPLYVNCFQPYKYYYDKAIDAAMQTKIPEFSKLDFLANLTTMHTKTFKKSTIILAFKKTSLISYNSKMVLQKIHLTNEQLSLS